MTVTTTAIRLVSIRAEDGACAGARLDLSIDRRSVLDSPVLSRVSRRYQRQVSIAAARHTITLMYRTSRFSSARDRSGCSHGIDIADIVLISRTPAASTRRPDPSASPTPTPVAPTPAAQQPVTLQPPVTPQPPVTSEPAVTSQPPATPQPPASGSSPWTGDFSTADLSQWDTLRSDALPGRITVATNVAGLPQQQFAGRFEIESNDSSPEQSEPTEQRVEVRASQAKSEGFPNTDVWYSWSVYFPHPGFTGPTENPNQAHPQTFFTQWKRTGGECGSPNAFFQVASASKPGFFLGVEGGTNEYNTGSTSNGPGPVYNSYRLGDFTPGRRYDFVFDVLWSSNPQVGFVEVWIDGVNVLPKIDHATLYRDWNMATDYGVYLRQGQYRFFSPGNSSVLYIAATRVGHSYAAVASDVAAQ